ncbi:MULTISPECIES: DUF1840 domain-containing protein [unclassified Undibacterium]|uniref:DUF1840 domain-containing protein n=1 Tax=unclassified Undibacterium TaxID=2630295 RepID=UPI002AC95982|nr:MULTISPECIES: DUF1840 domain-containing protein [unclassified Undibacterium]MEB0140796.1 DUF1840 domain-containing protein [Undibacterium sp. CCC2.1]MEB0173770.1 DUF1840 domain-containing protein [Undibacterium sp. CCC1.1]MEB0177753.1 DUF1840 domain-containing protein [Undibacterium sp. CCC3.4]MEB0216953.1 DUF1840 domain-containing protein [Undibacterium sp. 5I2]WPX44677.1 DUF1840 domain-containing protein [Undibacterium sp. CCC3.4]
MLITFKSKAATEITMYKEHARRILELLQKDVDRGIITPAELPHAIEKIEAAVADSKAHPVSDEVSRDINAHPNDNGDDHEHVKPEAISFATRVYPVLEMLHAANKMQREVMWGV